MVKPVIGFTTDIAKKSADQYSIDRTYPNAILAAGGIPVLLPAVPEADFDAVISLLDGIILVGGDDYAPEFYGERCGEHTKVGIQDRQKFDVAFTRYLLRQSMLPILGVCAGCQLINISLGGTLVQDIPTHLPESVVKHAIGNDQFGSHQVMLEQNSKLARLYQKEKIATPTWHHQSVKKLGTMLLAVAHAQDDIIEAVELVGQRFVVGVQWHPEQDIVDHLCLFQELVNQASNFSRQKQRLLTQANRAQAQPVIG